MASLTVKTVTVIGATGTMGANVAGIFASFGNAKVFCVGRDIRKVEKTIPRIVKSVRADSIRKNLQPADWSMLDDCIRQSDLVFESVAEDLEVKRTIARIVSENLAEDAISCTGSSGLSIDEISECYSDEQRKRCCGVHMFNPPYSMTLCELIPSSYADPSVMDSLAAYLAEKLLRTVVMVKDSPAFLANRIGFQFINEAMQYAERFKDSGGIDYIDAILGPFSGRAMAPLATADFVGLDIHKAIVDNLYSKTSDYEHETFRLPEFASSLIKAGRLGRKSGEGLYKTFTYDNGLKRQAVYDLSLGTYVDKRKYVFPFALEMNAFIHEGDYAKAFGVLVENRSREAEICLSFLLEYIVYSLYCAQEVAYTPDACDAVMSAGFNWCPPLALYKALGQVCDVGRLMRERIPEICMNVDVDALLRNVPESKYDYRPYFKAGK